MPRRKTPKWQKHPDYPEFEAYMKGVWTADDFGPNDCAIGEPREYLFMEIPGDGELLFKLWLHAISIGESR